MYPDYPEWHKMTRPANENPRLQGNPFYDTLYRNLGVRPLVEGKSAAWRESLFLESLYTGRDNPFQEGIRRGKWKYIRMYDGKDQYDEADVDFTGRKPEFEMLFDLASDPGECNNLIQSHAGSPVLADLRRECAEQSAAINRRREEFKKLVDVQRRADPVPAGAKKKPNRR